VLARYKNKIVDELGEVVVAVFAPAAIAVAAGIGGDRLPAMRGDGMRRRCPRATCLTKTVRENDAGESSAPMRSVTSSMPSFARSGTTWPTGGSTALFADAAVTIRTSMVLPDATVNTLAYGLVS
jgi:hypothetical protein